MIISILALLLTPPISLRSTSQGKIYYIHSNTLFRATLDRSHSETRVIGREELCQVDNDFDAMKLDLGGRALLLTSDLWNGPHTSKLVNLARLSRRETDKGRNDRTVIPGREAVFGPSDTVFFTGISLAEGAGAVVHSLKMLDHPMARVVRWYDNASSLTFSSSFARSAFLAWPSDSDDSEVVVMGSSRRVIYTKRGFGYWNPMISPSGEFVVWNESRVNPKRGAIIARVSDGQTWRLLPGEPVLAWSADSRQILWIRNFMPHDSDAVVADHSELWISEFDGLAWSSKRLAVVEECNAVFDRDGRRVVYVTRRSGHKSGDLCVLDMETGRQWKLADVDSLAISAN